MLIQNLNMNGEGYRDVFFSKGWRISFADYSFEKNDMQSIEKLEKHLETDEAFVLLKGCVKLITGGQGSSCSMLNLTELKAGSVYVVEKGEWHVAVLQEDTEVLIVEDEKESASTQYYLNEKERIELRNRIEGHL